MKVLIVAGTVAMTAASFLVTHEATTMATYRQHAPRAVMTTPSHMSSPIRLAENENKDGHDHNGDDDHAHKDNHDHKEGGDAHHGEEGHQHKEGDEHTDHKDDHESHDGHDEDTK